mgnify:CR=1 FL=1|jgi:hypothetical protein
MNNWKMLFETKPLVVVLFIQVMHFWHKGRAKGAELKSAGIRDEHGLSMVLLKLGSQGSDKQPVY